MTTREKRILGKIDLSSQVGLEIGPLSAPIVKKEQSEIHYLDLTSREGLIKKYKEDPIDPNDIVDIDYVLKGKNLSETVKGKKFDYVVAAHVIEHVPNVLKWLQEVAEILKPGGVLSLVVPDKRYTFDIHREETTPSQAVGAYIEDVKKPSPAMIYDFFSNYIEGVDTAKAWDSPDFYNKAKPRWNEQEAYQKAVHSHNSSDYLDCHCSVFTPESFIKVLDTAIRLDLFDYKISHFVETQPYELEFYISLTKVAKKDKNKESLLRTLPKLKSKRIPTPKNKPSGEAAQLKQELGTLTNSVSWRVTKPLRKIRKIGKS